MIKRLIPILNYLRSPDRLITLVVLVGGIILALQGLIFGQSHENSLEIIILLLGSLGVSNLVSNYSSVERDHKLDDLLKTLRQMDGPIPAHQFFKTRDEWEPLPKRLLAATNTLDMIGGSLNSIAITHQAILQKLLERGVKLRIIIGNPDNDSLQEEISKYTFEIKSSDQAKSIAAGSLHNFLSLTDNTENALLQIRLTDTRYPLAYLGIDINEAHGQCYVELYLKKSPLNRNPMWSMHCDSDVHWVNEFKQQFEKMWESSIPAVKSQ